MPVRWKKTARGKTERKKGRTVWLAVVCVGLLSGSNIARLTGELIMERAVRSLVNPVCGLTAYAGMDSQGTFWQYILKEILSVPLPLISYAGNEEALETAITDPVYEKYLSSEVLYNGGSGPLLSGDSAQSENSSGDGMGDTAAGTGQNGTQGGQTSVGTGQNGVQNGQTITGTGQSGTQDGQNVVGNSQGGTQDDQTAEGNSQDGTQARTDVAASAAVKNHLPTTISGSLYTLDQLNNFDYLVKQLYFVHSSTTVYASQLDAEALLAKDLTIEKQEGKPQILIHHTHGTEAFSDTVEGAGMTILEVGDYLTELLEGYGYTVIHDRSIYPYDTAYSEANARVREILAANPTIEVVIDLHRDATGSMKRFVTELDGETTAQLMFFNGMCQTADGPIDYLNNPYLEDNLALSLQMKLLAEAYYPGLTRPNFLKAYQYNQHLMPRYTLVEAGSDTNTFEEVCRAMVPLAKILDAVLSDPDAVKLAGDK